MWNEVWLSQSAVWILNLGDADRSNRIDKVAMVQANPRILSERLQVGSGVLETVRLDNPFEFGMVRLGVSEAGARRSLGSGAERLGDFKAGDRRFLGFRWPEGLLKVPASARLT